MFKVSRPVFALIAVFVAVNLVFVEDLAPVLAGAALLAAYVAVSRRGSHV